MSDFDAVLERLLADPSFKAALAVDPSGTLAGYRLSADEIELLHTQVSLDSGGDRLVEQRTSKAGLFGLLSPLADVGGFMSAAGAAADGRAGLGGAGGQAGFGGAGPDDCEVVPVEPGPFGAIGQRIGDGIPAEAVPADYLPSVDADGDGHWDSYTVRGGANGGLDVVADVDGDGRVDFVGHDIDRDGVIDSADFDNDGDGRLETHLTDDNGDGWMDRQSTPDRQ